MLVCNGDFGIINTVAFIRIFYELKKLLLRH